MEIPDDPIKRRELFFALVKSDSDRRNQRAQELSDIIENLHTPVPDDLLNEIIWIGPTLTPKIFRRHRGFKLNAKVESLKSMLGIFNMACTDIFSHLDKFDQFSSTKHFARPAGNAELAAIDCAVKKELMAFSTAAASLVDHARGVIRLIPLDDYASQRDAIFDMAEHHFVISLRNLISHNQLPEISWQIRHSNTRVTDYVLFSETLMEFDTLDAGARLFINRCGEYVHVRQIVTSYSGRVARFYLWLADAIEHNLPASLQDYCRCKRHWEASSARSMYRILLSQGKTDPYKHLDMFLLPAQIEAALKLPMRSKQQVDFIIAAADKYEAYDDELRSLTYKFFGVEDVTL